MTSSLSRLQIATVSLISVFWKPDLHLIRISLAEGCDVVCCFVNDDVNSLVIDKLYSMGIKLIALRWPYLYRYLPRLWNECNCIR